jgi:hypothetical protein
LRDSGKATLPGIWEWPLDGRRLYAETSAVLVDPRGPMDRSARGTRRLRSSFRGANLPQHGGRIGPAGDLSFRTVLEISDEVISAAAIARTQPTVNAETRIVDVKFDLRNGSLPLPHSTDGMKIYSEPGGAVMYWAPERLSKWGEVQYRVELGGKLASVEEWNIGLSVYNRHQRPAFDPAAQGTLEVSIDGKTWTLLFSSRSDEAVIERTKDALTGLQGAATVWIRARLYATRSFNGNRIQYSQFLRSTPSKDSFPSIRFQVLSEGPSATENLTAREQSDSEEKLRRLTPITNSLLR